MNYHTTRLAMLLACCVNAIAEGGYVLPTIGGGNLEDSDGLMVHADVSFKNDAVGVLLYTAPAPRLRSLTDGNTFDPAKPFAVLQDKAFNAQYGWNPSGRIRLPANGDFWIEQLDASEGLEVYQAPPESSGYEPIFGTDSTSMRWKWSTRRMTHNYYAADDIVSHKHWASYRVYIGDTTTGEPLTGYAAAEVTFDFALPGDFDSDGVVDEADRGMWAQQFAETGGNLGPDANSDGIVNAADYTVWRDNLATVATALPEPGSLGLLVVAGGLAACRRRAQSMCRATAAE